MYLHDAMREALSENGHPMTSRAIAEAVNASGSYVRGDGRLLKASQVSARARNYTHLFERDGLGGTIRLRSSTARSSSSAAQRDREAAMAQRRPPDAI